MKSRDKMREIVEKGYDEGDYLGQFRLREKLDERETKFFNKLSELVPVKAKILDLGSGTGTPHDRYLVDKGYDVTGIDISAKHIALASERVPEATYIKADFSRYDLGSEVFDAVISLFSVFHIPREEHENLFKKIYDALKPDGVIFVTMGLEETEMDVNEFVGSTMAWSSYDWKTNMKLIENTGFRIVFVEKESEGEDDHLWILAKKTVKT